MCERGERERERESVCPHDILSCVPRKRAPVSEESEEADDDGGDDDDDGGSSSIGGVGSEKQDARAVVGSKGASVTSTRVPRERQPSLVCICVKLLCVCVIRPHVAT